MAKAWDMRPEGKFLFPMRIDSVGWRLPLSQWKIIWASVVGPDAELFTSFFVNNNRVSFTERKVDLSSYQGLVMLEARAANGTIVRLKVNK